VSAPSYAIKKPTERQTLVRKSMPDSGAAARSSMIQSLSAIDSLAETQQNCRVEGGLGSQVCIPVSENESEA
jgi:hypothetical protein